MVRAKASREQLRATSSTMKPLTIVGRQEHQLLYNTHYVEASVSFCDCTLWQMYNAEACALTYHALSHRTWPKDAH